MITSPGSMEPIMPSPELIAPVYIHPTAVIHPTARIGPNVSIGPRVLIGRGVRIKDSILLDNVEVKHDACIMASVIGWDSKVGSWVRIEGGIEKGVQDEATEEGYKRPTACILGKSVIVGDELIVRDCIVLPNKELTQSYHREIIM
jgi:mannose-1-phosphate guanylyltransferase